MVPWVVQEGYVVNIRDRKLFSGVLPGRPPPLPLGGSAYVNLYDHEHRVNSVDPGVILAPNSFYGFPKIFYRDFGVFWKTRYRRGPLWSRVESDCV